MGLLTELERLQKELILSDRLMQLTPRTIEFYLGTLTVELARLLPSRAEGGCEAALNQVLHGCLETYLKYEHLSQYHLHGMLEPLFGSQQKWYALNPATLEEVL